MAWIELHQAIHRHRKTVAVAEVLHVSRPTVVGHMTALWCWALDGAPADGGPLTALAIKEGAEWTKAAEPFVGALVTAGFVEQREDGYYLHDWLDYAGKLQRRRAANTERMRSARATNVRRTDDTRAQPVQGLQHSTAQHSTEPSLQNENTVQESKPKSARRGKAAPTLTVDEREKLIAKYLAPAGSRERVENEIDLALSHVNAKKYERTDLYVDGWLRRGFIGEGTTGGRATASGNGNHSGGSRQGGLAARGAGAGEAQRTYEGPPRPTNGIPFRAPGTVQPVAGEGAS